MMKFGETTGPRRRQKCHSPSVTFLVTFVLLHSSISPAPVLSQLESPEDDKGQKGKFHFFECKQFTHEALEREPDALSAEEELDMEPESFMYQSNQSVAEFLAGLDKVIEKEQARKKNNRKAVKLATNKALSEIDDISRGIGGTLCTTPSEMYKMIQVPIGTHVFVNQRAKADLIANFLQLTREKTSPGFIAEIDESELNATLLSLFAETWVENIRFCMDGFKSAKILFEAERGKNVFKTQKTPAEMDHFPWYFNLDEPSNQVPTPKDKSKFNIENITEGHDNLRDNIQGYWTKPYFQCGKSNPNNGISGDWLISYSVPFLMGYPVVSNAPKYSSKRAYGMLSFDIDLAHFGIKQCDFLDEDDRKHDYNTNPLHAFRETHKCDMLTTTCQERDGKPVWLKGNYVCNCNTSHYALYKEWNNSIGGREAEATWCAETQENDSYTFRDVVSCKRCPYSTCPDCNDKHTCMAEMNSTLRLTLVCISILCTLTAVGFIIVVCKFRRISVFKTSSPIFICIMLSGCIIMYSEMIALYPALTVASCIAVKWTRHLGFCITYTALALKLCRVYLTFRVKSAHRIKLTEKHLLHWMSPIMVIMLLYLFAWTISAPPHLELMKTVDDKRFHQCVYNWWDHALAIGEVIFLAYGVWICWKIRENPDAQFISYSIYNIAVVNVVMVSLHLLILPKAGPDMKYVLAFVRTQLSTSTTIGLVIGSKLIRVWRGETTSMKDIANSANGFGQDTLDLGEENLQLKEELQKMAAQIEKLKFYAMCKNNPHLKQSSANLTNAEMDFNRFESFSAL